MPKEKIYDKIMIFHKNPCDCARNGDSVVGEYMRITKWIFGLVAVCACAVGAFFVGNAVKVEDGDYHKYGCTYDQMVVKAHYLADAGSFPTEEELAAGVLPTPPTYYYSCGELGCGLYDKDHTFTICEVYGCTPGFYTADGHDACVYCGKAIK